MLKRFNSTKIRCVILKSKVLTKKSLKYFTAEYGSERPASKG
jgi:hypothetical protein